jgi:hypothetical protein
MGNVIMHSSESDIRLVFHSLRVPACERPAPRAGNVGYRDWSGETGESDWEAGSAVVRLFDDREPCAMRPMSTPPASAR